MVVHDLLLKVKAMLTYSVLLRAPVPLCPMHSLKETLRALRTEANIRAWHVDGTPRWGSK